MNAGFHRVLSTPTTCFRSQGSLNRHQLVEYFRQQFQIQRVRSVRLGAGGIVVHFHEDTVDSGGHGYVFRHALTRDAVYEDMLPGERIRLAVSLGMRESFEDGQALGRDLIAREPPRLPFTGNRIYGAKETPPSVRPTDLWSG